MRKQHLGLVGDREVGLAGGDQLDRRRRVGRRADADVEAGFLEVAELLRHVDPGVVGVGVEVERQAERLALRRSRPRSSRRRRRGRGRGPVGRRRGRPPAIGRASSPAFYRQVTMRRSARATRPKRPIAIAERTSDRGEQPGGLQLGVVLEDQVAQARVRSPTHSPKTAAIGAKATAIFAPLKMKGRAVGASTPPEDLPARGIERAHHLHRLRSTERRPSSVSTAIGKKQTSATIAELGPDPEAEPDDQDRRDDDDRDRLRGDEQRVEGESQCLE